MKISSHTIEGVYAMVERPKAFAERGWRRRTRHAYPPPLAPTVLAVRTVPPPEKNDRQYRQAYQHQQAQCPDLCPERPQDQQHDHKDGEYDEDLNQFHHRFTWQPR